MYKVIAARLSIVLSMPRTLAMDDTTPPMGLLMLAAVVEHEHKVRIVFPVAIDQLVAGLPDTLGDADVFGLSINSFSWFAARRIIATIRRYAPRLRIVLGGPHPSQYDRHCLEVSDADAVVRGEGEATFPELLRAWSAGEEPAGVAGVTWKTVDGEIHVNPDRPLLTEAELNALPLPAYHLIPPNRYGFVPMETSRGCRFRCVFCAIPFPRGIRQFSLTRIERTLNRLNELRSCFTRGGIFLSDDSFSAHKERAEGTLQLVRQVSPEFMVGCEARITELVNHNLLPAFARTRTFLLQVGVECGYDEGLARIKKGLSRSLVTEFASAIAMQHYRYNVYWSFIVGFPWETEREVLQTINFAFHIARASGSQQPQVNAFSPYPGSIIVNRPQEFGLQAITPQLFDEPTWFRQFLGYSRVAESNRAFIAEYLQIMHNAYPRHIQQPLLRMPNGVVLDNRLLA